MKIYELAVLSTLALSACLPRAVVENEAVAAVGQGDAASVGTDVIGNNTAVADGANGDNQNGNKNDGQGNDENEDDADNNENNNNDDKNNGQNGNENLDQILNGELGNGFQDINIDPNDILGSLGQNIFDLLLGMGICNFNLNSLQGLGLGNQIQLLLQLQQLQQLQSLGIVNSFTVDQLIQREILSRTFNLDIIKRSIDASVQRATRGKKRTTILKRQCANAGQLQSSANAGQDGQNQADKDQVNQDQADKAGDEGNAEAEKGNNASQDSNEGIEVP